MSPSEPFWSNDGAAPVFAALGDPTRLEIVQRLSDGRRRSIAQIAGGLPQSRQAVTKHLMVLADAGLIAGERVGREHHFALRPESIGPARDYLDQVARQWDDALARLRRLVEDDEGGASR